MRLPSDLHRLLEAHLVKQKTQGRKGPVLGCSINRLDVAAYSFVLPPSNVRRAKRSLL
jgi:hypothetical protein